MKLLVVGGGGREHAIVKKIKQNTDITEIFCAPGNAGIANDAKCIPVKAVDIPELVKLAVKLEIDFAVIGPDDPLALGAADAFIEASIPVFGPCKNAAVIEYSKAFSKNLMKKYNIPTAAYQTFTDYNAALEYIKTAEHPLVVKADGLALGKGVIICNNTDESSAALMDMMQGGRFGKSGETVVIEEMLHGPEVTVLAFSDGKTIVPMLSSQDHKRAFDNDEGPNTGGMGAFSPSPLFTEALKQECYDKIFKPTLDALIAENIRYIGVIYFGLMLTKDGAKVIEYNSRFGDPEAQAVLTLLDTDLYTIMRACVEGRLNELDIKWKNGAAACIVLASGGYPGKYDTGYEINGLDCTPRDVNVFHAGTALKDGKTVTSGGRVLGVTAAGDTLRGAVDKAYAAASQISFKNMFYRKDIGKNL